MNSPGDRLMARRFLLITMAFPPKGVVGALRTYRLCKSLPGKGWLPEVIATHPWGTINEGCTLLDEVPAGVKIHRTTFFDPYLIYRRWLQKRRRAAVEPRGETGAPAGHNVERPARKPSLARRFKLGLEGLFTTPDHMVFWNLNLLWRGFRILRGNRDLRFILTSSPPHSSLIAGMVLSRLFRLPHVVDLRDPWGGLYRGEYSAFRKRVERALERWVIGHASRVISSTDSYCRMSRERFPECPPEKFVAITNCFEPEKFDGISPRARDKFTICYLGIFYPMYNPYPFFTALRLWLDQNPKFRPEVELVLVGAGDQTTLKVIRENGLEDIVTVTGRIAHEQAIAEVKSAHLLLLLMGISEKVPLGWMPVKLFEYLACRKPILAYTRGGEAFDVIRRTGAGHTVTSDDPAGFIEVLDQEYGSWRQGESKDVKPGIPAEIEKFTSHYTNQQFADLFNDVDRS